jgi:hypothetical protein
LISATKNIIIQAKRMRPILILIFLSSLFVNCAGRKIGTPPTMSNIAIPTTRTIIYQDSSLLKNDIIQFWANAKINEWGDEGKIDFKIPRAILGRLLAKKDIQETNAYLLKQFPKGKIGSKWLLNPYGGYDFTAMSLMPVLYLFDASPELLYPETKQHLINNILTIKGAGFSRNVPRLCFQDSENHILMGDGSRYLMNQYLWDNGEKDPQYDNKNNGVEAGLIAYLKEIEEHGIFEYNAKPYLGYTYSALMNLNAFGRGEIKTLATKILDHINWQYALNSYDFKHCPPYRRRFKKNIDQDIVSDYHSVMLTLWASQISIDQSLSITRGKHIALWATMLPYRPADDVLNWCLAKPNQYFVKIGHGHNSCPEICSGDSTFLLTSGGANQGRSSLIVPQPTVLFLADSAKSLKELFYLSNPDKDFMRWNNSGVYQDFACGKGSVHVPKNKKAEIDSCNWSIFPISKGIFLGVYSKKGIALLVIVRESSAKSALSKIIKENPDHKMYKTQFMHPNGNLIAYDLDALKNTWVIKSVNNRLMDRDFEKWPFFEGDLDGF